MCIKREYKCYKGEEDEECCNARVREALRNRNYSFVLILGIALMIISLVIKTSSDAVFVNQVSFASTITSIILSVIAIWMSITGERSTNEIKTKVTDSVNSIQTISSKTEELINGLSDMLSKQNESGNLVTELKNTLSKQNESYNSIKDQIEVAISDIGGVKSTVKSMNDFFMGSKQNMDNIPDNTFTLVQNIINGISIKLRNALCEIITRIFQEIKNGSNEDITDIYVKVSKKVNITQQNKDVMFGIIIALHHNGFFKDDKNYENIKKVME